MESGKNTLENYLRRLKTSIKDLISDNSTSKNFINLLYESILQVSDLKERINFDVLMVNIFFYLRENRNI